MVLFLTSHLNTHIKNEQGERFAVPIEDENQILSNIKKHLKGYNRVVFVANNRNNYEENDIRISVSLKSFEMSGLNFKEKVILDGRNEKNAKEILHGADLIVLCGGKCWRQIKFLRKIKLKKILKHYDGVLIGISAGSMNMCKKIANFPEEMADLKEPRWFRGLGFFDEIFIPHFDGETKTYQIPCEEIDLVNDYVLPMSHKHKFLGVPNGSYVLIDNGKVQYYGKTYIIENEEVSERV